MELTLYWVGKNEAFVMYLLGFSILAIALTPSYATRNIAYRAAVYEHAVVSAPPKVVSRTEAVANMMRNVRVYEKQTKIAANKVSTLKKIFFIIQRVKARAIP